METKGYSAYLVLAIVMIGKIVILICYIHEKIETDWRQDCRDSKGNLSLQ